jgi:hypothetical protein
MHKYLNINRFIQGVFITLIIVLFLSSGKLFAQFTSYNRSYNKWDRIVFRNNPPFKQRIFTLAELNFGYGAHWLDQPYEIRRSGGSIMLGYRYNRTIAVGVGAGLESYNGGTVAPLYVEGHIYLNGLTYGSVKPVLTGSAGYLAYVSGEKTNINVFASPSFGLLIPVSYRSSVMISIGLFTQWEVDVERYSYINGKIGLHFY